MSYVEYNNIYVGASGFELEDRSEISVDDYGLDSFTDYYAGTYGTLADFLLEYPAGSTHPNFPQMFLIGKPSISRSRSYTKVALNYAGKITVPSPYAPLVTKRDSWREDTVQGQYAFSPTTILQLILDYRAPTTTYTYVMPARPEETLFGPASPEGGAFDYDNALGVQVLRKRGAASFVNGDFPPLATDLQVIQRLLAFERTQVGNWWQCEESWEFALIQSSTWLTLRKYETSTSPP